MLEITITTYRNWNMLKHVFPIGEATNNEYLLWIDDQIHKEQIKKIKRVNEYLGSLFLEHTKTHCCFKFVFKPADKQRYIRYGKLPR